MKKLILITTIIIFGSLSVQAVHGQSVSSNIKFEEAYTVSSDPEFGTRNDVHYVGYTNDGFIRRLIVKPDFSTLPSNIDILSASMSIRIDACEGESTGSITIARIVSDWQSETLSWDNKPGFSSPTSNTDLDCLNQLATFDISDYLQGVLEEQYANNGLVIFGPDGKDTSFYFRNFDISDSASLIAIDYDMIETTEESTAEPDQESDNIEIIALIIVIILIILSLIAIIILLIRSRKQKKLEDTKDNSKNIEEKSEQKHDEIAEAEIEQDTDQSENKPDLSILKKLEQEINTPSEEAKSKRITMNKKETDE